MRKFIASFVGLVFFFSTVSAPLVEANFWKERRQAALARNGSSAASDYALVPTANGVAGALNAPFGPGDGKVSGGVDLAAVHPSLTPAQIKLLPSWVNKITATHGSVTQAYFAPDAERRPLIVHVQDIHEQIQAQMHISGLISEIVGTGAVSLVGLEGARGSFDLAPYRTFPNKTIIGDVADFLVEQHMIGGGEHAAWTMEKDPVLWGVEEMGVYLKNLNSFKTALPIQKRFQDRLAGWEYRLSKSKTSVYSSELKSFDEAQSRFRGDQMPLPDFVGLLAKTVEVTDGAFPTIVALNRCFAMEKALDFSMVESQRAALIEALTRSLSQKEIDALVQRTLLYKSGRLSYGGYYDSLRAICETKGVSLKRFPEMASYIKYVLASEQIKPELLMVELDQLQQKVADRLVKTEGERAVFDLGSDLHSLSNLAAFQMSPHDWKVYQSNRGRILEIVSRMDRWAPGADKGGGDLSRDVVSFEGFCEAALSRDVTLVNNLVEKMESTGQKTAVLLAGGFHTEGMTALMKKSRVSYIVFTPTIENIDESFHYLDFIKDRPQLEKLFTQEKITTKAPVSSADGAVPGFEGSASSLRSIIGAVVEALARKLGEKLTDSLSSLAGAARGFVVVVGETSAAPGADQEGGTVVASHDSSRGGRGFAIVKLAATRVQSVWAYAKRVVNNFVPGGKGAASSRGIATPATADAGRTSNFMTMGQLVVGGLGVVAVSVYVFGVTIAALGSVIGFGLLAVVLHEVAGHLGVDAYFGGTDGKLSGGKEGIRAVTGDKGDRINAWVAIAGPLTNIFIAAVAGIFLLLGMDSSALQAFAWTNFILGLTTLLPIGKGSDVENFLNSYKRAEDLRRFVENPYPVVLESGVRHYPWGQRGNDSFIARLLGVVAGDRPYAELWMGAHSSLPSTAVLSGGSRFPLDFLIREAQGIMSSWAQGLNSGQLPNLLKVLAAEKPLSIQVHPNPSQAQDGFIRENRQGVPLTADHRSYKDPNHKPEQIVAVTDFYGLRGFKPLPEIAQSLQANPELMSIEGAEAFVDSPSEETLRTLYQNILLLPRERVNSILGDIVQRLSDLNGTAPFPVTSTEYWVLRADKEFIQGEDHNLGVLSVFLLNLIHLNPGEGLYLGAGVLHAYLSGVGMEIMANSDNVIRGGLTNKYVDNGELMKIVDFRGESPEVRHATKVSETEHSYRSEGDAPEFQLSRIEISGRQGHEVSADHDVDILIVVDASVEVLVLTNTGHSFWARTGQSFMVPQGVEYKLFAPGGEAKVFRATVSNKPSGLTQPEGVTPKGTPEERMLNARNSIVEQGGTYTLSEYQSQFGVSEEVARGELDHLASLDRETEGGSLFGVDKIPGENGKPDVYRGVQVDSKILGAYDIRGPADRFLTDKASFYIGRGYGQQLVENGWDGGFNATASHNPPEENGWKPANRTRRGDRSVAVVGGSVRLSTPRIKAAFMVGLRAAGVDVYDIGTMTTSSMYHALAVFQGPESFFRRVLRVLERWLGWVPGMRFIIARIRGSDNFVKPLSGAESQAAYDLMPSNREGSKNIGDIQKEMVSRGSRSWGSYTQVPGANDSDLEKMQRAARFEVDNVFVASHNTWVETAVRLGPDLQRQLFDRWVVERDDFLGLTTALRAVQWPETMDPVAWKRILRGLGLPSHLEQPPTAVARPLAGKKIAVDFGNGSGGRLYQAYEYLGAEVTFITVAGKGKSVSTAFPDGAFPAHKPDPSKLDQMVGIINFTKNNPDYVGLAFDEDQDRLGIFANGEVVSGADAAAVVGPSLGGLTLTDVRYWQYVVDAIAKAGGQTLTLKVGYAFYIDAALKIQEAIDNGTPQITLYPNDDQPLVVNITELRGKYVQMGIEPSGHAFFRSNGYANDAAYYSGTLLHVLAREMDPKISLGRAMVEGFNSVTKNPHSPAELRIQMDPFVSTEVRERMVQRTLELIRSRGSELLSAAFGVGGLKVSIDTRDGGKLFVRDSKGDYVASALIRKSNNEAVYGVNFEGRDDSAFEAVEDLVMAAIAMTSIRDSSVDVSADFSGEHTSPYFRHVIARASQNRTLMGLIGDAQAKFQTQDTRPVVVRKAKPYSVVQKLGLALVGIGVGVFGLTSGVLASVVLLVLVLPYGVVAVAASVALLFPSAGQLSTDQLRSGLLAFYNDVPMEQGKAMVTVGSRQVTVQLGNPTDGFLQGRSRWAETSKTDSSATITVRPGTPAWLLPFVLSQELYRVNFWEGFKATLGTTATLASVSAILSTKQAQATSSETRGPPLSAQDWGRIDNLGELRGIAAANRGPTNVIAIVNGGDAEHVRVSLDGVKRNIFRGDGSTTILAYEEKKPRGQFFGLLAAIREWKKVHGDFDADHVASGIMMPGKGTRMSPLTQWAFGIKPFISMLIRATRNGPWLSAAAASIFSWTLVTSRLEALGFRGIAWKWGDEPQISSNRMDSITGDFSTADAIRVGKAIVIPDNISDLLEHAGRESDGRFSDEQLAQLDDLARNKEWLIVEKATGRLLMDVRRRPLEQLIELRDRLEGDAKGSLTLMTHMGSPAFSYIFIDSADSVYGDEVSNEKLKMDVDGYLFAALTMPKDVWDQDVENKIIFPEEGGNKEKSDAYFAKVQKLRAEINGRRGVDENAPIDIRVLNMGSDPYWGDIGQLSKARESLWAVNDRLSPEGDFARRMAMIDGIKPDEHGNIVVGSSQYPRDGTVRNSVIIDSVILAGQADGAVFVNSQIANAQIAPGAVVVESTVENLTMGKKSYAHGVLAYHEDIMVKDNHVRTTIPVDMFDLGRGFEQWGADMGVDVGKAANYDYPIAGNPMSFNEKAGIMRERRTDHPIAQVETEIADYRKAEWNDIVNFPTRPTRLAVTEEVVPEVLVQQFGREKGVRVGSAEAPSSLPSFIRPPRVGGVAVPVSSRRAANFDTLTADVFLRANAYWSDDELSQFTSWARAENNRAKAQKLFLDVALSLARLHGHNRTSTGNYSPHRQRAEMIALAVFSDQLGMDEEMRAQGLDLYSREAAVQTIAARNNEDGVVAAVDHKFMLAPVVRDAEGKVGWDPAAGQEGVGRWVRELTEAEENNKTKIYLMSGDTSVTPAELEKFLKGQRIESRGPMLGTFFLNQNAYVAPDGRIDFGTMLGRLSESPLHKTLASGSIAIITMYENRFSFENMPEWFTKENLLVYLINMLGKLTQAGASIENDVNTLKQAFISA